MRSVQELKSVILNSRNEQEVKEAIQEIVSARNEDTLLLLIQVLDTTTSRSVRNAVALGLRDLKNSSAVPVLIKHIIDPNNATSNGTMIYALETLDARSAMLDLVSIACRGDYETIAMTINAVEAFAGPISAEQKNEALIQLTEYLKGDTYPDWKREMLLDLYDLIDSHDAV